MDGRGQGQMPVTSYISIDGMLYGEVTGGVMRNYWTDALGSVVETVLNGVEENTYQYSPYGRTIAKTGTAADPKFLWNGASGYRETHLLNAEFYVRRRYLSSTSAQWTTRDPLWPDELPYNYAICSPTGWADSSGLLVANCCCVPISITLTQAQWPISFQDKGITVYGWSLVWTIVIGWTWVNPTSSNQSGCRLTWTETRRFPHVVMGPITYDGNDSSVLALGWANCKQPGKCTQGYSVIKTCTLRDSPASENPSGGQGMSCYQVDITLTVTGGSNCGGTSILSSYTFCEIWNNKSTGSPDSLCPQGVTCK